MLPIAEPPHVCVEWAGEGLYLLPERAPWRPAAHTLFVADLHLGKAATYRALGQPVPHGTTQDNLARLDELITHHQVQHLVCLGDFLHAPAAHTPHVLAGHLHPVVALQGPGRDRMRLPCFVSEPGQSILPAFGAFTGGHVLDAAPGRQHHAVGGERVWTLPPR